MEILSDTVFHGDVSIGTSTNPKSLKLYGVDDGGVVSTLTIGQTGETEILKTDGFAKFGNVTVDYLTTRTFDLSTHCGSANISLSGDNLFEFNQHKSSNHFYFDRREPGKTYYIATQDQIPSRKSFPFSNELPINFDVPAECTRFYVHGALNGNPASIQMFKRYQPSSGEAGTKVVNVDLAWVCGSDVQSDTKGCAIVVEKSSSFAMRSTDGYSIRTIYLPTE